MQYRQCGLDLLDASPAELFNNFAPKRDTNNKFRAKKSSSPTTCEFDKPALLRESKKPLRSKGFVYDSDWARTSDLYPVKVVIIF